MATVAADLGRSTGLWTSSTQVAKRVLLKFMRSPALIIVSTVQGAMFLLIFRYVFGGAIGSGPVNYVDFLVPGFITTGVLFSGMMTATGVAEDIEQGFIDRLRSLPIARSSVLIGRALADTVVLVWGTAVTVGIGFAVGFRLHGSAMDGLAAFGLCIAFGFAITWVFVAMGLLSGSVQAANGYALMVFPLVFVSSAYVPVESMPGWLQPIARNQPITLMVDAVRALALGTDGRSLFEHDISFYVTRSLLWAVVITAVFGAISVARYRKT